MQALSCFRVGLAALLCSVAAFSSALAHTLVAPEVVEVERDGSFRFEALFRVGPGQESLSFYEVYGSEDLDLPDLIADGECLFTLDEGSEIPITILGSLIDPSRGGTAFVHLVTCGLSGFQTVFDVEIDVRPFNMRSLYWIESGTVRRAGLEGEQATEIVDAASADAISSIALDPLGGRLYWIAFEEFFATVSRANALGGQLEPAPGIGGGNQTGLAIDGANRNLYLADPSDCLPLCGYIRRVGLDGMDGQLLTNENEPRSIDVSPEQGRLCWSDVFDDWIQCADLDADNPQTVVSATKADGVALDPVMGKVYWTDRDRLTIRRADSDGAHLEELVTSGLVSPRDIALDPVGRKIYWTDDDTNNIRRANLDGSHVEAVLAGLAGPQGIAVDSGLRTADVSFDGNLLRWPRITGAGSFDVVRGDLGTLRQTAGDFVAATDTCFENDVVTPLIDSGDDPGPGVGYWFLVRGVTATGNGTYDSWRISQVESRDVEIGASAADCP